MINQQSQAEFDKRPTGARNLAMEAVRVTEAAALSAVRLLGRGDEMAADKAAVDAMHSVLSTLDIDGTIRIGDGEEHAADKLFAGEKAGSGQGPKVDVALMPLEGPTIVARGESNGLSLIAMIETNGDGDTGFLNVPDIYMSKIAVGPGLPDGIIDLDREPAENLQAVADAKGCQTSPM